MKSITFSQPMKKMKCGVNVKVDIDTVYFKSSDEHTGVSIANILKEAVEEWGLPPNQLLVTDNASNMIVAAGEFGSEQVGCLAHTLNLACGNAL